MYMMQKGFHPVNFAFARRSGARLVAAGTSLSIETVGTVDDIYRVRLTNAKLWPKDYSRAGLSELKNADSACRGSSSRLVVSGGAGLRLVDTSGAEVLRTLEGASFGVCGKQWLFQFAQPPAAQFFGMGEKSTPFEKSGRHHKFWNTDAYGDFTGEQIANGDYDPDYITIPYVIIKQNNTYAGILIDNPFASIICVGKRGEKNSSVYMGAEDGPATIYIIYGPSLAELTRKFQNLTGRMPLPPAWALGYHQCRWGYRSSKDLKELADSFEKHQFPASGLWLDIDYMRGYRVFTFEKKNFASPKRELAEINKRGYRVVPIIDPGVKKEEGYPVYDSGHKEGVFCRNATGEEYVGMVWPGYTVFPDFTQKKTREWWAGYVKWFAEQGIGGAWLDMNDPSTGFVECVGMLFENGKAPHDAYHSQYASFMAMASRDGFLQARPNERPFLISRSGYTGAQKYSGHWTGDNVSNYHHLQRAIGRTLNLAMSGVVLNAPDIGGFMGDTTPQLLVDWMKACFLFPFCRNHTCVGTRAQEPWAFDKKTLLTMRQFTRTRYKLIPYLYNLFAAHETDGTAVLRPLFHEFADSARLDLGSIDDQVMIGPWIMQAPFVVEKSTTRAVTLPPGRWFALHDGRWESGNRKVTVVKKAVSTPMYLREGALLPMQPGVARTNGIDLTRVDLLCALPSGFKGESRCVYVSDDGLSFDYRAGKRTRLAVSACRKGSTLEISVKTVQTGFGPVEIHPVTVDTFRTVTIVVDGVRRNLRSASATLSLSGNPVRAYRWR